MSWLSQHAEEVSKNASDITKAVQKLVQSSLDIAHHIQQPLEQLPTLQEQVRLFESRAAEYYSRSRRQQDDANTAVAEAEELYLDAQNMLATVRDYSNVLQEAKTRSEKSIQDVTELSSFHRSKILFANNVSKSVESSHNLSDTMILLSETVGEHAKDEHKVISKTFVLSKKLKNATAIERGITAKNNTISDHVRTMVEPVREKCLSTTRDTHEAINNSTRTVAAAVELLTKVTSVSEKLDEMIRNFNALPTINVKPLAGMKSDIARIKENLEALKLTSSLEKLRQGKVVQEKWLAEHKPRVTKLRESVALAQNLIASLKDLDCNE